MERTCLLCQKAAIGDACYIKLGEREHPACRTCWEQVLLDPRRVVRTLQSAPPAAASPRLGPEGRTSSLFTSVLVMP